jgi:hypothetical protein
MKKIGDVFREQTGKDVSWRQAQVSGQQPLVPGPGSDGSGIAGAELVGVEHAGAGDEAVFWIAEGLEQFVGDRCGGFQQAAAVVGDVIQDYGSVGMGVLAVLSAALGALPGAGIQGVDAKRDRTRAVEGGDRGMRGVIGHVCYEGRFDECGSVGCGTVAGVAGEEWERAQQLVDDFAGFSELQVDFAATKA